jgi:Ca2+-binding EF-hand superfamily protein
LLLLLLLLLLPPHMSCCCCCHEQVFNRVGEDTIQLNELETIMTRLGEPLTPEEMKQLIAQAADEEGENSFNYEKFIRRMLSSHNR